MSESTITLPQLAGALVFAARHPLTARAIRHIVEETAQTSPEVSALFQGLKDQDVVTALAALQQSCQTSGLGFELVETADGYRFQSSPCCGPWLRRMLESGKPARLSRPALETLAIIAYRQPATRAEIENVRGVAVDHVLRLLMELQLVRITGRSELPGRPLLYGTTPAFLEHFGLRDVHELPGVEDLARLDASRAEKLKEAGAEAAASVSSEEEAPPEQQTPAEEASKDTESPASCD